MRKVQRILNLFLNENSGLNFNMDFDSGRLEVNYPLNISSPEILNFF